ncbi:type III-A CRISPR-associated protein Csm2 [Methanofollis formosanus]|nr:type III-A CRISPR-associated protein Csm2 [Methanofollis formosanus]
MGYYNNNQGRNNSTERTGGRSSYGGPGRRDAPRGEKEYIKKIQGVTSLNEITVDEIAREDGIAERAAKDFGSLKPSQLRRLFGVVKKIENTLTDRAWPDVEAEFYMIRPLLAYAKGRDLIPQDFYTLVTVAMQKVPVGDDVQKKANYKTFVYLLESIVAYHKYYHKERA